MSGDAIHFHSCAFSLHEILINVWFKATLYLSSDSLVVKVCIRWGVWRMQFLLDIHKPLFLIDNCCRTPTKISLPFYHHKFRIWTRSDKSILRTQLNDSWILWEIFCLTTCVQTKWKCFGENGLSIGRNKNTRIVTSHYTSNQKLVVGCVQSLVQDKIKCRGKKGSRWFSRLSKSMHCCISSFHH